MEKPGACWGAGRFALVQPSQLFFRFDPLKFTALSYDATPTNFDCLEVAGGQFFVERTSSYAPAGHKFIYRITLRSSLRFHINDPRILETYREDRRQPSHSCFEASRGIVKGRVWGAAKLPQKTLDFCEIVGSKRVF